jgi:hypothetical protein
VHCGHCLTNDLNRWFAVGETRLEQPPVAPTNKTGATPGSSVC